MQSDFLICKIPYWFHCFFINSQIKLYLVSICLLLLWKTWFIDSAMVDLLSQKNWATTSYSCCNSERVSIIHLVWHADVVATTYSASVEDNVTMGFFFEVHVIDHDSKLNTYPYVLFLPSIEPAKSLSRYPNSIKFEFNVY